LSASAAEALPGISAASAIIATKTRRKMKDMVELSV
jgi:hypothetical protein